MAFGSSASVAVMASNPIRRRPRRRRGQWPAVANAYGFGHKPSPDAVAAALLLDPELALPRWRRPSLLEARRADPIREPSAPAPRLTFDHGLVGALDGRERRLIGYNVVRLLDTPDELRGARSASSTRATRSSCSKNVASTGSCCARMDARAGSTR